MKLFFAILSIGVIMMGCNKEDGEDLSVDKDGLTKDIRNIIPDDILEKIKALGIDINGGNNPPDIEGKYFISPLILVKSNFSDNYSPGYQFFDAEITFSKQDNDNLTIETDFQQVSQEGQGLGSFITGSDNKFSVFVQNEGTVFGLPYTSIDVYSGEITPSGIKNHHHVTVTVKDNDRTIKRGEGRLVKDGDGLSERIK